MRNRLQRGIRISILAIVTNVLLATIKLVAGLVGHSYALVADAIESLSDCVSSVIVWGGLVVASRPPDESHPYGHGKADPLAALVVGVMLMAAAVGISAKAIHEIIRPHHAPAPFTLVVLVGVVVLKEGLFRLASRVGNDIGSVSVRADAWHHRSDAITSLMAAVGISIALIGGPGYEPADDWAALLASFVIGFNGARFARLALHELMDTQPPTPVIEVITRAAYAVPGVRGVEKVLARKSGPAFLVDMHLEVDGDISVRDGHDVAHRVKEAVQAAEPSVADVLIHVEPVGEPANCGKR